MKKNLILRAIIPVLFILWTPLITQATIYNDNGSSLSYNLLAGDVLNIQSGTYIGRIDKFEKGALIKVMTGATFKPAALIRPQGNIINVGTSVLSFSTDENVPLSGFSLDNFSIVQFLGSTNTSSDEVWFNRFGATLLFSGEVQLNAGVHLTNNGTIQSDNDLIINGGTYFLNNNLVDAKRNVMFNGGTSVNKGTLQANGNILYPLGTDHTNNCRLIAEGNFETYNTFINDGFIWVKGANKVFTNYGHSALTLMPNSIIKTPDFINYSTINGSGSLYFTGNSYNLGTVGSNTETGTIKVFEASRVNPTGTFDYNWGTIHPNVSYSTISDPPDSYRPTGCADLSLIVVLPLKWNYIQATVKQDLPVVSWKASFDNITDFIVERSYDQQSFQQIASMVATKDSLYTLTDHQAPNSPTLFYRIKAIGIDGKATYSEIRKVLLIKSNAPQLRIIPNPTVGKASIVLQAEHQETIQLTIRNITGLPIFSTIYKLPLGHINVEIPNVSQLPSGLYIIEVKRADGTIQTAKLIKQQP